MYICTDITIDTAVINANADFQISVYEHLQASSHVFHKFKTKMPSFFSYHVIIKNRQVICYTFVSFTKDWFTPFPQKHLHNLILFASEHSQQLTTIKGFSSVFIIDLFFPISLLDKIIMFSE